MPEYEYLGMSKEAQTTMADKMKANVTTKARMLETDTGEFAHIKQKMIADEKAMRMAEIDDKVKGLAASRTVRGVVFAVGKPVSVSKPMTSKMDALCLDDGVCAPTFRQTKAGPGRPPKK